MDVDPETLLFTQDSVKNTFKALRENERIDDAVDAILRGDLEASNFPALTVVSHAGRLWSLDNRRLWVFKKARVSSVTVVLRSTCSSTRFLQLINCNQPLVKRILEPGYWPRVRGYCRSSFDPPVRNFYNYLWSPSPCSCAPRLDMITFMITTAEMDSFFLVRNDPGLVGPVRGVRGDRFPSYPVHPPSSTRVVNANSVKVADPRENQLTTARKASEGGESDVACVRRDGRRVPRVVLVSFSKSSRNMYRSSSVCSDDRDSCNLEVSYFTKCDWSKVF
ncbi:hypothetical protein R1sor_005074 [Riccia sorocarpa]|uniref:Uncharacterized protein n=1 Tax=Riccia sorocarpa TaxID=122646 RepID=A0ABD3HJ34_9MARC